MIALWCVAARVLPAVALRTHGAGAGQDITLPSILPPYWLHVPKTGSSFATSIAHLVCGDRIPQDVIVKEPVQFHHQWGGSCPKDKFLYFESGHGPLSETGSKMLKNVVVMVRDPTQRILSGYYARPEEPLHDCPRLRQKYHCKSHGRCDGDIKRAGKLITNPDVIPPVEYAECVQNCATNMLTGSPCASTDPPDVYLAVANLKKMGFVGLTGEWELSVCLWHAKFGGDPLKVELHNTRPGVVSHSAYDAKGLLGDWQPTNELVVYQAARERFYAELQHHNLTAETCGEWLVRAGATPISKSRGAWHYDED